jgi:hypothetical protein
MMDPLDVKDPMMRRMIADAAKPAPVFIEHHIAGKVVVSDADIDGRSVKVINVIHEDSGQVWVVKLPLASARNIAEGLTAPPAAQNGHS